MLSAFGNMEYARVAFKDFDVADFLDKHDFANVSFIGSVKQVFARKVCINLNLEIHIQAKGKLNQFVRNIDVEIDGQAMKNKALVQDRLTEELQDLLCRLFHRAQNIMIKPLIPGYSGAGVFRVQPFYPDIGTGREVIVKFGATQKIQREYDNFKKYVEPSMHNGHNTVVVDRGQTPHLGGIVYSLLDTSNDQLVDFGSFYRYAALADIENTIHHLFYETCGVWYDNRKLQPMNLRAEYQPLFGDGKTKHEQRSNGHVKYTHNRQRFSIPDLDGDRMFTNPLAVINDLPLSRYTFSCTTHGDFNPHNVLVNNEGHTWLIDFQETGPSHILRDVAMLDAAIRFQLLEPGEVTLFERLQLEEVLCRLTSFSQLKQLVSISFSANRALEKAYKAVVYLRNLAHDISEQHQNSDDMSEYIIALLFSALNTLQFSSLSSEQREHALISASMLADRLVEGC